MKKLVTHNGSFHADDIFAAATLILYLEKDNEKFSAKGGPASGWEIIRTRDEAIIEIGDYVFDVGMIYDPEKNRFDHHQPGGAGKHSNGIEYASFGLVWKKFGEELCGSKEAAEIMENKLISPIDAGDNGINLVEQKGDIGPYYIQYAFNSFYPRWDSLSHENMLSGFLECVEIAKVILRKEIDKAKEVKEAHEKVLEIYENTKDKRIIILDQKYPYEETLSQFSEPIFVIYPRTDGYWAVKAERKDFRDFKNKKDFPAQWGGLRDQELVNITGVSDAVFCHRALFMCVAKSKDGATKLAEKALRS